MPDVEIREVTDEAVKYVAENMRLDDVAEVWALSRLSPQVALDTSVAITPYSLAAYVDGRPAAVFGVYERLLGNVGVPWLLGTDDVLKGARVLLQHTKPFLKHQLLSYRRLENEVHAENRLAVRYLRWAGFTLSEPYVTSTGATAIRFWMERNDV